MGCCLTNVISMFQMSKLQWASTKLNLSGGRLNIKMPSYQYRDSHAKDKTVSPTVLSLTWGSPYLGKMVFILTWGSGSELGIFQQNKINIMADDALAPCVTRSSAAVVLTSVKMNHRFPQ